MSESPATVFDRILAGEIPCHRVYEDEHVLAFLDVGPLAEGHTLVIPKERKAHLHELSDESAAALGRVLPRLCRAVLHATGATDYNVLQNNGRRASQAVMHVHFHIIPKVGRTGLGIGWPAGNLEAATAAELVAKIRSSLAAEGSGSPAAEEAKP
jgi:histidine triad (HIT) family protein